MYNVNFRAPSELFSGKKNSYRFKSRLIYRRFDTLAEAVKYAIEDKPGDLLHTTIEVQETTLSEADIRRLYQRDDYPLLRTLP